MKIKLNKIPVYNLHAVYLHFYIESMLSINLKVTYLFNSLFMYLNTTKLKMLRCL